MNMRLTALVVAASALLLLGGLDRIDLWAPDEPRYAQVAEELRSFEHGASGLVLLHLNGVLEHLHRVDGRGTVEVVLGKGRRGATPGLRQATQEHATEQQQGAGTTRAKPGRRQCDSSPR